MKISDLREIHLPQGSHALRHFIEPLGHIIRDFEVAWRGPVVFTGDGSAWALANVLDITPWREGGFCWKLGSILWLPSPIPYNSGRQPWFKTRGTIEPLYAGANLCRDIEALGLELPEDGVEQAGPQVLVDEPAPPSWLRPAEAPDEAPVETASSGELQRSLF